VWLSREIVVNPTGCSMYTSETTSAFKKSRDYVHLINFVIMMCSEGENCPKRGVFNCGSKDGVPVHGLHISSCNKASFTFYDRIGLVAL
jgi:predicted ester cyclase